jgi:predicted nucleotidyltransferase
MDGEVASLMKELKEGLARIYGRRLRRVYLYGSYARWELQDSAFLANVRDEAVAA